MLGIGIVTFVHKNISGGREDVKACSDGLEHFFQVCPFDRGGGGLKLFGQCPYGNKKQYISIRGFPNAQKYSKKYD